MQAFSFHFRHNSWSTPVGKRYRREVKKLPCITAEREAVLLTRATQGDTAARDELLLAHLPFVMTVAKSYRFRYVPLSDLVSEGNLGLLRAIEAFDPSNNIRLLSYATWWIRFYIQQFCQRFQSFSAGPPPQDASYTTYRNTQTRLEQCLQRPPTEEELAEEMQIKVLDVRRFLLHHKRTVPLNAPLSADRQTSSGAFSSNQTDRVEQTADPQVDIETDLDQQDQRNQLYQRLSNMTEDERYVLKHYYGLEGQVPRSFEAIVDAMEISWTMVQKIHHRAIQRLRMEAKRSR